MILGLIQGALEGGARLSKACGILGLNERTVQRWRAQGIGEDRRYGPRKPPGNKLSAAERKRILQTVNRPEYRELSPKQIVPLLAEQGKYLASESTLYRLLRQENQLTHRAASRPPRKRYRPTAYRASGPNEVWSWDITFLKSPVRGEFYRLYMVLDVWSRKIVDWAVHRDETAVHASQLLSRACELEGITREGLVVHSDNGSPMKGATLLATFQELGIVPSYSRPRVSDDNPYSEALFRTVKYRPEFPTQPFSSIEAAREWVEQFVEWYNNEHRHSGIRYVTPGQRHRGEDVAILQKRDEVYRAARNRHPERWSGKTRDWSHIKEVELNPEPKKTPEEKVA